MNLNCSTNKDEIKLKTFTWHLFSLFIIYIFYSYIIILNIFKFLYENTFENPHLIIKKKKNNFLLIFDFFKKMIYFDEDL